MADSSTPKWPSRRTVAKGAAWAVPAIAVAVPAASVAASPPEEPPNPTFQWTAAYKNPGNSCTSACVPKQSYGVPVVLSNLSAQDFQIQFTSYVLGGAADGTGGTDVGVFGVTAGVGNLDSECIALNTGCTAGCVGPPNYATNAVCVPAGTASLTVYVTSNDTGSSPNVSQRVNWRWVRKSDCTVTEQSFGYSAISPPTTVC